MTILSKNPIFDFEKSVQAINYFANKTNDKARNKLLIVKLMWAADRYHIRKYGRPVTGDTYYAMKNGPVASCVLNILDKDKTDKILATPANIVYLSKYLSKTSKDKIESAKEVDAQQFSDTDIEALEFAFNNFGDKDSIVEFTHIYPEWKKHESVVKSKKRASMNYMDFFENPSKKDIQNDPFELDNELIEFAKEDFQEYLSTYKALYT